MQLIDGRRRRPTWAYVAIAIALAIILGLASAAPYLDYLWFKEDVGYVRVFTLQYSVRGMLFGCVLLPAWLLLNAGWSRAFAFQLVYADSPPAHVAGLAMAGQALQRYGAALARVASLIVAFLLALGFSEEWQTYLLSAHAASFGRRDPIFGLDYSVFVFHLPWWQALDGVALAVAALGAVVHVAVWAGLRVLRGTGQLEVAQVGRGSTAHFWLAGCAILLAVRTGLGCLEFGVMQGSQFVGAGYAGMTELRANELLAVALALWGAVFLVRREMKVLVLGLVPFAIEVIGVGIVPALVQAWHVNPDKNNVEAPFAARALAATKFGYDLETIDTRDMPTAAAPTAKEVAAASSTFQNMRLWDPGVFRDAIAQLQGLRPYYAFHDVDIDRYSLAGPGGPTERMVMIAPRDINLGGLNDSARTWVNTRLTYTHGYGVVVAPVNTADSMGQPSFLVRDIPMVGPDALKVDRPQLYFSDFSAAGDSEDPYAVVNTRLDEFDYLSQDRTVTTRWTGRTGIRIDDFLARLSASLSLGDVNLLIAPSLTPGSRLLLHRGILDRAARLYPFLSFDADPYVTILGGRLVWLLDGYTSTDRIPYSAFADLGGSEVNYVRNSVKIAIDAYTGETTAYAVRPDDPILSAWRSIYPGLVKDLSAAPAALQAHFRYPEDLFDLQTRILCAYHVSDPRVFLGNSDAWSIPNERGLNGDKSAALPYYILMRLPDDPSDEFLLMRGFTPNARDNMSGWLAAHCDPGAYGKLTLYVFSRGETVLGPAQVENLFVQDPTIANINRQLNNDQSEIVVGNLLVVPVGSSVVYVESLFLQGRTGIKATPELKKVVMAVKNRIVVADTYDEALKSLLGVGTSSGPAAPEPSLGTAPSGSAPGGAVRQAPGLQAQISAAAKLLDEADGALRKGDFAAYGELQRKARAAVQAALQAAGR